MTREHVIPQWISRLLPEGGEIIHVLETAEWSKTALFSHTVADVCEHCNSGWMSELEMGVRRFLGDAIFADPPPRMLLSPQTQVMMATWVVKTMLMLDRASGTGRFVMPDADFKRLYSVRQPPRMARVYLARTNFQAPETRRLAACYHGHTARWSLREDDGFASGYVASMQIGFFGAIVANVTDQEDTNPPIPAAGTPFEHCLVRAWPPSTGFVWPPVGLITTTYLVDQLPERL